MEKIIQEIYDIFGLDNVRVQYYSADGGQFFIGINNEVYNSDKFQTYLFHKNIELVCKLDITNIRIISEEDL